MYRRNIPAYILRYFLLEVGFKEMCFLEKKIEYQESLLELVVKKICRNVFSKKYVMLSIS